MKITIYNGASHVIRHAAHKLSEYAGFSICRSEHRGKTGIKIELNPRLRHDVGRQGYMIKSVAEDNLKISILITGSHDEGIANGIFTMLRTLIIKNIKDPFNLRWDLTEKPWFSIRNINIAPYRFGGSYGYAVLSPDRWSKEEWIEYIDLLRLCNMTSITLNPSGRLYHPDYPQTVREKWRYDVWKEVIDYCHHVGIKVNYMAMPGMVPQEAYWKNPDLRSVKQEAGGYFGCGLRWKKAKKLILDIYRYTFDYLSELDGLEMIYSEAGFFI
jgi:hypothetical protein